MYNSKALILTVMLSMALGYCGAVGGKHHRFILACTEAGQSKNQCKINYKNDPNQWWFFN